MELITLFLLIVLIIIVVIFGFIIKHSLETFQKYHQQQVELETKKRYTKDFMMVKLQSYERLTIFLDRIDLDQLVLRSTKAEQTMEMCKAVMIKSINEEFNHNIVQQLYVSEKSWNSTVWAKEKTITLIEESFAECEENENGIDLGRRILIKVSEMPLSPSKSAIYQLKKDAQSIF
jgi:hypothetical protein